MAALCVIAELTVDRKRLVFTAFDPLKGRGPELTRLEIDPALAANYVWDLSPDGSRLAVLKYSEGRIHVLSLGRQASKEIAVKGWNNLQSVNWAADGKGLFVSGCRVSRLTPVACGYAGQRARLVGEQGNADPLYTSAPVGVVPSPDGRHLAIFIWSLSANVWMMENF